MGYSDQNIPTLTQSLSIALKFLKNSICCLLFLLYQN